MKLQPLLICVFALASCGLFSCSDETIVTPIPTPVVYPQLKKVTQTTYYSDTDFDVTVSDFFYDENQMLTNMHTTYGANQYEISLAYAGDKVTQVEVFENGNPHQSTGYFYNGDVLAYTLSGDFQNEKTVYAYQNAQIASVQLFYPDDDTLVQSATYAFENGNVKEETKQVNYSGGISYKNSYTYGDGINPMRGMNRYLRLTMQEEGFDGLSSNMPLTKITTNPVNNAVMANFHYAYIYNTLNLPTNIKRFDSGNNFLVSETTIEYQ